MESVMKTRLARVGLFTQIVTFVVLPAPASALGALGHHFLARWYAQEIVAGRVPAPAELRQALQDPQAVEAFCGGAVAPDSTEKTEITHQGTNGDSARAMLEQAKALLADASTADDTARALRKVAFSYGWITHLAADDVVHPLINLKAGDTYRNLGPLGVKEHARWEILLDASIQRAVDPSADPYEISFTLTFSPELKEFAAKYFGEIGVETFARDSEATLAVLKANDGVVALLSSWFGLEDPSMTPEGQVAILREFFLPVMSKYVDDPESFGNGDRDVGPGLTDKEFDEARAAFLECLRREPDGLLLPNLYAEVATAIGSSTANVCLLSAGASDGLGAIEKAMAELEKAGAALERFRGQATTVAAALRELQARYVSAAAPSAFGRRITEEPATPAACRNLEDLARQVDGERLTLASLAQFTAEVGKTLDDRRARLKQPDPAGAAAPRESEFLDAMERYRALNSSAVLGSGRATLATRTASVSLPTAEMPELGPLPVVLAKLKSQARCLRAELALLSSIPEAGRASLFPRNADLPDEAKSCEKYAADFLASPRLAYEAADATAIESKFDALQQQLTGATAADTELRALVAGLTKALEVVRLRQGERTRAQLQRQDLEACHAQLLALEQRFAAAAPPPVPPPNPETAACAAKCLRQYDREVAWAKAGSWAWSDCPSPWNVPTNACVTTWMACDGKCGLYETACKKPCMQALQPCCRANALFNAAHSRDQCLQQCPK